MSPWAFSLLLWAAMMFPQALPVEVNRTLSPDTRASTTLSGMQEAPTIDEVAMGRSTMAPVPHDIEAASTLPPISGTQEPIKITTDQGGVSSQPASNVQSTTNHQVFSEMTSKPAHTSGSSMMNTIPTSTHALSNVTYSTSHSTSRLSGSTTTPSNLTHSMSNSTSESPHSTSTLSDLTHSTSQSTTGVPDSTFVTSSSINASLYKHKGSSDSTQASAISISRPTDSTNSSMGALVPKMPLTTISAKTKSPTIHHEGSNASGDSNSCTSRKDGLVNQCLIAIASLAGVATFFMVCTIILCTKLSAQKHRYRMRRNQCTEMMCISNLLPDGDVARAQPRHPKNNGALIPSVDESEGDELTLNSFLPEN